MPPVDTADQSGSTATATTEETAGATASVEKSADESAPESAPDKDAPEGEPSRSERRTNKRIEKAFEDRARERIRAEAAEAKAEAYERELEELKSSRSRYTSPEKPTIKALRDSGKYTDYDDLYEAYAEQLADWKNEQARVDMAKAQHAHAKKELSRVYQHSAKEFAKANPLVDMQEEKQMLENELVEADMAQHHIATSENPAALIHYFAEHPDDLDKLADLPDRRVKRFIEKIEASIASGVKPQPRPLPKPPANVNAAIATSFANLDEAQRDAAKRGDTKRWQQIEDEKRRQKRG